MTEAEINQIFKDFDHLIVRYVESQFDRENNSLPFSFPVEDVIQEVRIKIWEKLISDYDPNRAIPRTFIIAYLPNTYRGVIYHIETCLKYTGNTDKGFSRSRRSETGKLRKELVFLSDNKGFLNISSNEIQELEDKLDWEVINKEMKKGLEELYYNIYKYLLEGFNQSDIGYIFNLSPSLVSSIVIKIIKPKLKSVILYLDYI